MKGRIGSIALATLVSRALGFVKSTMLVFAIGGTSSAVGGQAFEVANTAPLNLYGLLAGGILGSILLPQLVAAIREGEAGNTRVNRLLSAVLVLSVAITAALTLLSPAVVFLYASAWPPSWLALATLMSYWCMPQLIFYILLTVQSQILNSRDVYGWPAWAPAVSNMFAIVGLAVFMVMVPDATGGVEGWTAANVALLCGTATLAVAAQTLILFPALRKTGFTFSWDRRVKGLGGAARVATWTFGGVVASQLAYLLVSNVASAAGARLYSSGQDGASLNSLSLAYLLLLVPHAVLTVSIATATFTKITQLASSAEDDTFSFELRRLQGLVLCATLPFAVFFLVAGPRITNLFWATPVIGGVLQALAFTLVGFGQIYVVNRALYALHDGRGVFTNQIVVAILTAMAAVAAAFVPPEISVGVIAAGTALANAGGWASAELSLRRMMGQRGSASPPPVRRFVLSGALAAAVTTGLLIVLNMAFPLELAAIYSFSVIALIGVASVLLCTAILYAVRTPFTPALRIPWGH